MQKSNGLRHDDFCPCARFHCDEMHCTCGVVETASIVDQVSRNFAERLRRIAAASPEQGEAE